MSDEVEVLARSGRGGFRQMAGSYGHPASVERRSRLAKARGIRAAAFAMKRAEAYLLDVRNPVDGTWLRLFAELCDRCGLPRLHLQASQVNSTSQVSTVRLTSSDVQAAISRVRANPEDFVVKPIDVDILRGQAVAIAAAKAEVEARTEELRAARAELHEEIETRPLPPPAESEEAGE